MTPLPVHTRWQLSSYSMMQTAFAHEKSFNITTDRLLVQAFQEMCSSFWFSFPISTLLFHKPHVDPKHASPKTSVLSTNLQVSNIYLFLSFAALSDISTGILSSQAPQLFWFASCLRKNHLRSWRLWHMPSLTTLRVKHTEKKNIVSCTSFIYIYMQHTRSLSLQFYITLKSSVEATQRRELW